MKKGDIVKHAEHDFKFGVVRRTAPVGVDQLPAVWVYWLKTKVNLVTGERVIIRNRRTGEPDFLADALYENRVEVVEEA